MSAVCILKRDGTTLVSLFLLLLMPLNASGQSLQDWVAANCEPCEALMAERTGVYILEKGEEALMGRAWLAQHAKKNNRYPVFHMEH